MARAFLTGLVALGMLMGLTTGTASAADRPPVITAPTRTTFATAGGRHVTMICRGRGRVPVVFLAGGNDPGISWDPLIASLGKKMLTCVYDRPGAGSSDPSPTLLTPKGVVKTLRTTLSRARIGSRFVLVGHSIGGSNALVFGARYPRQTAGAVLVDPSQAKFFQARLGAAGALTANGYDPQKTVAQIAAVKKWPAVPLVLLARDPARAVADGQATVAQEQIWTNGIKRYAALSPKGSRIVVPGATHYVHVNAPDVTADAIRSVVKRAS